MSPEHGAILILALLLLQAWTHMYYTRRLVKGLKVWLKDQFGVELRTE